MGEYGDFGSEKNIIITTQILAFFGKGENINVGSEKIKLNFKKGRLKEMELLTIMESIAKLRKRLAKLDNFSGYAKKVNNGGYLLFESKEHYKILKYLEKITFNLLNLLLKHEVDEHGDFFILAQIKIIEDFIKRFPLIKIDVKSFNLFRSREEYGDFFESIFPTLDYYFLTIHTFDFDENSNFNIIVKKLEKMSSEVEEKLINLKELISEMLSLIDI